MSNLLIVEKDSEFREKICSALLKTGYVVKSVGSGQTGIENLQKYLFDVLVIDIDLPDMSGMAVIDKAQDLNQNTAIIVITSHDTLELAVNAIEGGVYFFLQKPFPMQELVIKIKKALEQRRLTNEINYLRHERKLIYRFDDIIGESPKIKRVFTILSKLALSSNSTVLITGETGTGKELVAGAVHYSSTRASKSFVKVNCAALPDNLLESELFGHEKGAFTGADKQRIGRCEQANEGTLFLDEVSEMSPMTQAKILRFIQEKEFQRVGGTSTIQVNVRLIAATNKNLIDEVKEGRFREDLFYRLHVINVDMPPLRERKEDIRLLADFFLNKYGREIGKVGLSLHEDTLEKMKRYNWPGNIRELENTIERAVLLSEGKKIMPDDIWMGGGQLAASHEIKLPAGGISLEEAEKSLIVQALEESNWVQKKAAELLGISQRVIHYKINNYNIKIPKE